MNELSYILNLIKHNLSFDEYKFVNLRTYLYIIIDIKNNSNVPFIQLVKFIDCCRITLNIFNENFVVSLRLRVYYEYIFRHFFKNEL